MSEKENQRVMLTKRLIKESLIRMLGAKGIYKIAVRELCQDAEVNRTTFYKYYGSPYDVLSDMEEEFLSHVREALTGISKEPERQLNTVCAYLDKNAGLVRLLTDNNVDPAFPEKLFSLPPIRQMLLEKLGGRYDERSFGYVFTFVISGGYHLLREWIARDERESPEEIAALVLNLEGKVCL